MITRYIALKAGLFYVTMCFNQIRSGSAFFDKSFSSAAKGVNAKKFCCKSSVGQQAFSEKGMKQRWDKFLNHPTGSRAGENGSIGRGVLTHGVQRLVWENFEFCNNVKGVFILQSTNGWLLGLRTSTIRWSSRSLRLQSEYENRTLLSLSINLTQ